jgi:hypothetical protein
MEGNELKTLTVALLSKKGELPAGLYAKLQFH